MITQATHAEQYTGLKHLKLLKLSNPGEISCNKITLQLVSFITGDHMQAQAELRNITVTYES
jgi:hypothetical protein